jgi:hypothetical protein
MSTDPDRPYRGRRLSWAEFYKQHPHLRPADNDNKKEETDADSKHPARDKTAR